MPRARKTPTEPGADLVAELCTGVHPQKDFTNAPDEFWRLCREYPHRAASMVYVWRLRPEIDRTLVGLKHSNIAKWPLDRDDAASESRLLDEHGSGLYQLRLNDSNRGQGRITVAMARIEIDRPDRPAVIPPGELVNSEKNASFINWCRANGMTEHLWWEREKEETMSNSAEGIAVQELSDITRELLSRDKDRPAAKDPFELALQAQQVFGAGKGDAVGDLVKIMKLMNETRAESGATTQLLMTALLDVMKDRRNESSGLGQVKEILELVNVARESGGGGGDGSPWASFFQGLPAAIAGISQIIGNVVALKTAAAAAPGGGVPVPFINQPTDTDGGAMPQNGDEQVNLMGLVKIAHRALAAFMQGVSGDDFAHGVCMMEPELYNMLAGMGKEQMLQILQTQPGVWAQVEPRRAAVEEFLDAFIAYGDEPEGPEGPEVAA